MTDEDRTKERLIEEVKALRCRAAELEQLATERQRVEEALQQMALFAELDPAPVLRFDDRGSILSANAAAVTILGEKAQRGTPLVSLLPSLVDIDLRQCVRDGLIIIHEATVGEQYFQFTIRGVPEFDLGHIYASDITERKKAEERLLAAERLATLGQFSGNISHELRNPLSVIDSSAYYLKTRLKDADERVREHLDRIRSSVGNATAIIQSLLDLTRLKEARLARLDLIAIIANALATTKVPARVKVIRNFPKPAVWVNADGEQLGLAFTNIIANAVEAMAGRGTLTVAVQTKDGQVAVSFADTGPGIMPENLDKVFQPFFTTKARGIGFGLSIAKMVIDRHSGLIEAQSAPGRGATLIIRLPLYPDKSEGV